MQSPNQLSAAEDGIEYTDLSSDIDFVALFGQPVRRIEIVTASPGTLVVQTARSGALTTPVNRTFTALASGTWLGGTAGLQVNKIIASGTSSIAKLRAWL